MTDLKTAALVAYKEQSENKLAHNARVQERIKNFFDETFGMFPDSVAVDNGGLVIVTAGEVQLQFLSNDLGSQFFLIGTCPNCGQTVMGQQVYSLESLGASIGSDFVPHYSHNCEQPPEPDPMLAALQEIAAELKRANDRSDTRGDSSPISPHPEPATGDPFMPPDEVWRWLPDARCVAVDKSGEMYWYNEDVVSATVAWSLRTESGFFGSLGSRTLAGADWRTTKRYRPAHL